LTVSLEGMVDGVGGRGFMKARGVLGGSMLGITLFQLSTKDASTAGAAETSVEKGRARAERKGRERTLVAWRNMVAPAGGKIREIERCDRNEETKESEAEDGEEVL
jgi:hypothetical protein